MCTLCGIVWNGVCGLALLLSSALEGQQLSRQCAPVHCQPRGSRVAACRCQPLAAAACQHGSNTLPAFSGQASPVYPKTSHCMFSLPCTPCWLHCTPQVVLTNVPEQHCATVSGATQPGRPENQPYPLPVSRVVYIEATDFRLQVGACQHRF